MRLVLVVMMLALVGCDQDATPKRHVKTEHALDWARAKKARIIVSYCPKCAPITPMQAAGIPIEYTLPENEMRVLREWEKRQK